MLRRNTLNGSFELNFVVIYLVFVTFFIPNLTFPKGEGEEKSNQKNQVLCKNSKVFA